MWGGEISELRMLEYRKSGVVHEPPLYDEKIGGWCALSARREISTFSGQELRKVNNFFPSCTAFIR